MKKSLLFVWEITKIILVATAIVLPVRYFLFQPFFVRGQSMEPNFENGDYLIVDELSYKLRDPLRGETIVFKYPNDESQRYIKRIIGLPGETIEIKDNQVIIYKDEIPQILNETEYLDPSVPTVGNLRISLSDDEYFVMGDNRPVSSDSRRWGVVPDKEIIGRAVFRAWPFDEIQKIDAPEY